LLAENGRDTEDTDVLIQALDSGDSDGFLSRAVMAQRIGIDQGYLKPRAGGEGFTLGTGQKRFDASGNVIAENVAENNQNTGMASAVTKIFDNGTAVQALPNGNVQVRGPGGEVLQGQARLDALKQAREEQIDFAQTRSAAESAGSQAVKISGEMFDRLANTKTSIANYDAAIKALDDGAQTGAIMSRLPSFRAASVELDNIQKRLGLDVIGNTTFGALSQGELDLALSVAIPKDLTEDALRQWLTDKRDAQQKLSGYLESAAIYLGTPGNTPSSWLEAQKELRTTATNSPTDLSTLSDEELLRLRQSAANGNP
jgi:hypothetical protein